MFGNRVTMLKKLTKFLNRYGAKSTIIVVFTAAMLTLVFYFDLIYFLLSIVSGWIMYGLTMIVQHRYMSHSVFEAKNTIIRYMLYLWTILFAAGSPLSWAYSHRLHHKYTDVFPDPQSPKTVGYVKTFFAWPSEIKKFETSLVKDLLHNSEIMFLHTYYYMLLTTYILAILFLSPIIFGYLCLSIAISYSILGLLNTWAHSGDGIKKLKIRLLFWGEDNHAWHHKSIENSRVVNTSDWDWQAFAIINFLAKKDSLTYREKT